MIGALLCGSGLHRPSPAVVWNGGYGFTRCARCGRDMVRSLLCGWRVPKGHRVVWRDRPAEPERRPPAPARAAPPAPARAAPPAPAVTPDPTTPTAAPAAPRVASSPARRMSGEAVPSPFDFGDFDGPAAPPDRVRASSSGGTSDEAARLQGPR